MIHPDSAVCHSPMDYQWLEFNSISLPVPSMALYDIYGRPMVFLTQVSIMMATWFNEGAEFGGVDVLENFIETGMDGYNPNNIVITIYYIVIYVICIILYHILIISYHLMLYYITLYQVLY